MTLPRASVLLLLRDRNLVLWLVLVTVAVGVIALAVNRGSTDPGPWVDPSPASTVVVMPHATLPGE
jgi:hypothetical protein